MNETAIAAVGAAVLLLTQGIKVLFPSVKGNVTLVIAAVVALAASYQYYLGGAAPPPVTASVVITMVFTAVLGWGSAIGGKGIINKIAAKTETVPGQ